MADIVKHVEYDKEGNPIITTWKIPSAAEEVAEVKAELESQFAKIASAEGHTLDERVKHLSEQVAKEIVKDKLLKHRMPEQDPVVRAGNFDEVALGYTPEMAIAEARRCLNCPKPHCREGCPVSVRIPEFIAKVAEGDFDSAYDVITSTNSLPAVSGRVCPQEKQCESKCVRGIKGESVGIGRLERFVADWHMNKAEKTPVKVPERNGHKIAVVGSGPAGLTCAGDLIK